MAKTPCGIQKKRNCIQKNVTKFYKNFNLFVSKQSVVYFIFFIVLFANNVIKNKESRLTYFWSYLKVCDINKYRKTKK